MPIMLSVEPFNFPSLRCESSLILWNDGAGARQVFRALTGVRALILISVVFILPVLRPAGSSCGRDDRSWSLGLHEQRWGEGMRVKEGMNESEDTWQMRMDMSECLQLERVADTVGLSY